MNKNKNDGIIAFQDNIPARNLQDFLKLVEKHDGELLTCGKRDYRGFLYSVQFNYKNYNNFLAEWSIILNKKTLIERLKEWINN